MGKDFLPEFDFDLDNDGLDIKVDDVEDHEGTQSDLKEVTDSDDNTDSTPDNDVLEEDSEETEDGDTKDDEDSPEKDESIEKLFQVYLDNGLIDEKFKGEFKGTAASFAEILEKQQEEKEVTIRNSILESVHPDYRDLVKILLNKGENLTHEDFQNYFSAAASNELTEDDFENEDIAQTFLKSYFMNTFGDTEDEALEKIELLGDKVTEKAKLLFLKEKEIQQKLLSKAAEESEEEYKKRKQNIEQFKKSIETEIKEAPYKPNFKSKLVSSLKTGEFKETLSQITRNPKALVQLAAIVSFYDPKTGQIDLNKVVKTVATKDLKNFKESIEEALSSNKSRSTARVNKDKSETRYEFLL